MKIEPTGLSFLGISAASLCITSHVTFSKCFPQTASQQAVSFLIPGFGVFSPKMETGFSRS